MSAANAAGALTQPTPRSRRTKLQSPTHLNNRIRRSILRCSCPLPPLWPADSGLPGRVRFLSWSGASLHPASARHGQTTPQKTGMCLMARKRDVWRLLVLILHKSIHATRNQAVGVPLAGRRQGAVSGVSPERIGRRAPDGPPAAFSVCRTTPEPADPS